MDTLVAVLKNLKRSKILVVGDIMLDIYVSGTVEKISPEAPIPIFKVGECKEMLGGAGNVIKNLVALGASCEIAGIVGEDVNGQRIKDLLHDLRVNYYLQSFALAATTTKTRFVASNQQVLRTDVEEVSELPEAVETKLIQDCLRELSKFNCIILSDYKKGVLSKRVCQEIISAARSLSIPVLVDPKGTDFEIYRRATVIKPNKKEFHVLFPTQTVEADEESLARTLLTDFSIDYCLLTLGEHGMKLISKDFEKFYPALKKEVFDVSGAGDSVIATFAAALSSGADVDEATYLSNIAGGIVVGKRGTSTVTALEIQMVLGVNRKRLQGMDLIDMVNQWKSQNLLVGFTNGCFDILHIGHIQTLIYAKAHCDKLVVGINSDACVKRLKGDSRPINGMEERCALLSQLECVDAITVFDEETPERLIKELMPAVLVKGADYSKEQVVGADVVESSGGKILLAPIVKDKSTTKIVEKIMSY